MDNTLFLSTDLTVRAVDAGMLVVTEEEAHCAHTFIAPHGVNAHLLASTVVVQTLIHICLDVERQREKLREVSKIKSAMAACWNNSPLDFINKHVSVSVYVPGNVG